LDVSTAASVVITGLIPFARGRHGTVTDRDIYPDPSRDHWFSMLDRPRKAVAQWYPLTDHVTPPPFNVAPSTAVIPARNADSQPAVHTPDH